MMISIRAARPNEAAFLTQLCLRSKASWGYDEDFMAACRSEMTLTPDMVAASCLVVAEVDARVTGMAQLIVRNSVAELDKLFVEPESHRLGVGRALLNWAQAEASGAGATALIVDADPYAAEFYRRCGAVDVGLFPSHLFPGRFLPRLKFPLSVHSRRSGTKTSMIEQPPILVREAEAIDAKWTHSFLQARWNGTTQAVHGEIIDASTLPALIAGDHQGLATYRWDGQDAELVTINAVPAGAGAGSALIEALVTRLKAEGCTRLWVTTTNDNLSALRFYLRRGFRLVEVRPGAVDEARKLKPSISTVGQHGIPLHDEIELCRMLDPNEPFGASMRSPWGGSAGRSCASHVRTTSTSSCTASRRCGSQDRGAG
jgi:GNAT superfamily N-acetyltransferase